MRPYLSMKIIDEYNSDFIQLELLEVIPDNLPTRGDRNIRIKINSQDFVGTQTVWLEYDLIQKFVA